MYAGKRSKQIRLPLDARQRQVKADPEMVRDIHEAASRSLRDFGQQFLYYAQLGMFHEKHCEAKKQEAQLGPASPHFDAFAYKTQQAKPGPISSRRERKEKSA